MLNGTLRRKAREEKLIIFYKFSRSGTWTKRNKNAVEIQADEIKFWKCRRLYQVR
jgi:hypothetical protein